MSSLDDHEKENQSASSSLAALKRACAELPPALRQFIPVRSSVEDFVGVWELDLGLSESTDKHMELLGLNRIKRRIAARHRTVLTVSLTGAGLTGADGINPLAEGHLATSAEASPDASSDGKARGKKMWLKIDTGLPMNKSVSTLFEASGETLERQVFEPELGTSVTVHSSLNVDSGVLYQKWEPRRKGQDLLCEETRFLAIDSTANDSKETQASTLIFVWTITCRQTADVWRASRIFRRRV